MVTRPPLFDLELGHNGVVELVEEGVDGAGTVLLDVAEDLGLETSMVLEHEGQAVIRSEL